MTAQATNSKLFDKALRFGSYGVEVCLESNSSEILSEAESRIRKVMLDRVEVRDSEKADLIVGVSLDTNGRYCLSKNGEVITEGESKENFFKYFESVIRIWIGEFASSWVFLHAGVVGWKGRGIVLPANSYGGKTTLVTELVRHGAEYYSDDYAVFDEGGLVHSFPRDLAIRGLESEHVQTEVSVESIGGTIGTKPLEVSCVLVTQYKPGAGWLPQILTPGQSILELIPHTLAVRRKTEYVLGVLNKVVSTATVVKGDRGDAANFVGTFLDFVDKKVI
jgi:hypothetical protein